MGKKNENMTLLQCHGLSVGYAGNAVCTGIEFTVGTGDYLCILGENGAGKSTLMKTILGLQAPLSGTIETENEFTLRAIGYLPQQTSLQKDFPASVWEIVLSGCQNRCGMRPFYSAKEKSRAREMMERLDITSLSRECFRELSGGQRQRVLLARAMCAADRMLLLDEPVTGLDPNAANQFYQITKELHETSHPAIVMITHDVAAALQYATHILFLGKENFYGGVSEFQKWQEIQNGGNK